MRFKRVYKKSDVISFRYLPTREIKSGEVLQVSYADDSKPNVGDFYIVSSVSSDGEKMAYLIRGGDIL